MRARLFFLGLLLAAALPAQDVKTVLSNGATDNRYDLVILGDGYTAAEQDQFDADVLTATAALFQKEPYLTFAQYFNVHSVFRPSAESGADHPDADPPEFKDTVYGSSYNIGGTARCLYISNTGLALQDASLAPAVEGRVMVLVNDPRYGGCAGTFSVSYNGASMTEVQIHELGHSFGGLADEYDTIVETYTGSEPSEKNVTRSATGDKWSQWLGIDGVAAFEGARYYKFGLFRPRGDCLMRNLGIPHCAVCTEQLILKAYQTVTPIEHTSPAQASLALTIGALQEFSFFDLRPPSSSSTIVWRVDGVVQPFVTSSFFFDTLAFGPGDHVVEVELMHHTSMVRLDPTGLMDSSHQWLVSVVDPGLPDITVESVQGGFVVGGQNAAISTLVRNDGFSGDSGTFTLEHFLSTDDTLEDTDIYLGSTQVANLAPGESRNVLRPQVRIPLQANPGVWHLWARVDRTDDVTENSEVNNSAYAFAVVNNPGCGPYLEYRDPLRYPHDSVSIDKAVGGTVSPTVIAPCATPGTSYLIVLGCSGTFPGTSVAPGVTVPLNQDACTDLVLSSLSYQSFSTFYGQLDEFGRGNATLQLPPGLTVDQLTGHFAAMLIDGSGRFSAATNSIEILIGF